jgi:quaternary ammonium compound-resistance protein SugE
MAWVYLTVAGFLAIVWSSAMKHSEGFTRLRPSILSLVAMVVSMVLLSIAMKTLPLGTACPVWTGIGAAGAFIFGIVALGEQASVARILAGVLIVSRLVLMKLSDKFAQAALQPALVPSVVRDVAKGTAVLAAVAEVEFRDVLVLATAAAAEHDTPGATVFTARVRVCPLSAPRGFG